MNVNVSIDQIDRILAYLPVFEATDNQFYEVRIEDSLLDPYLYTEEVNRFLQTLYETNFITSFDWMAWSDETERFINHPELLASCDLSTLQKLFTTHVWKDRFCSGHLASMIESKQILAILQRLAVIREQVASDQVNKT